jgi:hypothetical protein
MGQKFGPDDAAESEIISDRRDSAQSEIA